MFIQCQYFLSFSVLLFFETNIGTQLSLTEVEKFFEELPDIHNLIMLQVIYHHF